jgi:hypothetical protein
MSIRIKVNPKTGLATMAGVPIQLLREILTASMLYNMENMEKIKDGKMPPEITDAKQYTFGMIKKIVAVESALPRYHKPAPVTKAERFAAVRAARDSRLRRKEFLSKILGRKRA